MSAGKRPDAGGRRPIASGTFGRSDRRGRGRTAASPMSSRPSRPSACSSNASGALARSSTPARTTILQAGDVVAVGARRHVLLAEARAIGVEVDDRELLDFPVAALDVVLTNQSWPITRSRTWPTLHGRGVVLLTLVRGGEEIPVHAPTRAEPRRPAAPGGRAADVERVGPALGYIERPSSETDVVFVGLGILLGGFVGLLSVTVGALAAQPDRQRRRAHHGTRVRLAAFRAADVRTHSGAGVVGVRHHRPRGRSSASSGSTPARASSTAFAQTGPSLLVVGFFVALTPHVAALLFGRYVLKMNPVILLGACAGRRHGHGCAAGDSGRSRQQAAGARLHRAVRRSATSCSPRGDRSS